MTPTSDTEYDEGEHNKEVYAHFGLAYYQSGVIESGIVNALLWGEFITGWKSRIERDGKQSFDRKVYEVEFDAYMRDQFAQSMGNLIKRLDLVIEIPIELREIVAEGKKLRDFLAHHYFRERAADFVTRQGRDRMIVELTQTTQTFTEMDRRIQLMLDPIKQRLGLKEDALDRYMEQYMEMAYAGEPLDSFTGYSKPGHGAP